jgi:hypothetical protein
MILVASVIMAMTLLLHHPERRVIGTTDLPTPAGIRK